VRRFLVVGCGGSGGAALAYLMDQLRSDLAAHGVHALPRGWQFVHIDVPSTSDDGPDGLGNVQKQGGVYFGSGPKDASYRMLDHAVSQRFAESAALDSIGTWAPRDPDKVTIPISAGAGQYRAVGRLITLSRASEIRKVLERATDELFRLETTSEMAALRVPGLGDYNDTTPIVLVVSSMAGGAGASMALDVCRLLTLIPRLSPRLTGVFMVAPNIFDSLPEASRTGVRPNALAMLGEIVASQTGASRTHDVATLNAIGHQHGEGESIPFARVFPVGRYVGVERTLFGDGTPKAVYRGLGRGLAGMIMSGIATEQFVSFDLGNTASPNGDRDVLGWGSDWAPLPWGSYGFASLSMGRDRYAEYAAQRISRSCVDRLLGGHLQRGSQASSTDQVAALLDSQWGDVCSRLRLPVVRDAAHRGDDEVGAWMTHVALPRPEAEMLAGGVTQREVEPFVPGASGVPAQQWVPTLRQQVGARRMSLTAEANRAAAIWAFRWQRELLDRTETVVADAVAKLGLPYAVGLVERLERHLRDVVAPGAERLGSHAPVDLVAIPPDLQGLVDGLKGVISNGGQLVDQLVHGYRKQVRTQIYAHSAVLVKQLLLSLQLDVLAPLRQALSESQRLLEIDLAAPVTDLGLARLATDQCAAWPSEADVRVPARFDEADNEVLLTSSADFQRQYESDIQRAVATGRAHGFLDARTTVVGHVVSGRWPSAGGVRAPGGLLERLAPWRSRAFPINPDTSEPLIPSQARYDLRLRPPELLGRSRAFVARPGDSFDVFCRLSIRDFVLGKGAAESELAQRQRTVVDKFTAALSLARPLSSVNGAALQAVHAGSQIEYRYKFSEVPFAGLPVDGRLKAVLSDNPTNLSNLESAFGDSNGVTKIDIFGSYPNYSPLVFDAVLTPVAEQWAQIGDIGRESFWMWRRSRPLDAALPMGDAERRAMVAGWFIGQTIGQVRIPSPPYTQPVQIWDAENMRWLSFPHPLLTPPSRFIANYDWLPAVLESVLLAIARTHEAPVMSSMRPFQVLRALYDATSQGPVGGIDVLSARQLLVDWLTGERAANGGVSRVEGVEEATTVDERVKLVTAWLGRIRDLAGTHFMAPGNGAPGNGTFAVITRRQQASATPIFRDLAPDVHWATGEIIDLLESARVAALNPEPVAPNRPPAAPPNRGVVIPDGGGPF